MQEGKTGKRQYKYRLTIQEGRVIKKELIQVTLIEEPVPEITELGTKVVKKSEKNDQPQNQLGNKVEELNHVSTNPKAETKVESIINSQKKIVGKFKKIACQIQVQKRAGSFLS